MEVNIVRVHLVSGQSFDADSANMLDSGMLDTDSFDAAGEGAKAIEQCINKGHGILTPPNSHQHRSLVVIEPRAVVAFEERSEA